MKKRPVEERFWEKVDRSGGDDSCWGWKASCFWNGYGQFFLTHNKPRKAHRVAWEFLVGKIPDGMFVLHECDNPPCSNPAHLFLGTIDDNIKDMMHKHRHRCHSGEEHYLSNHTWLEVHLIRLRYALGGATPRELANIYRIKGRSHSLVYRIINNIAWAEKRALESSNYAGNTKVTVK